MPKTGENYKAKMPDWQSIPIPNRVMHQIGIDLCKLSEVDGFKHLFLCIISLNYYLWLMIRLHQLVRKNLPPWMYENSNQWSGKRIRKRSNHLYRITAVEQKITSAYHPQLNGISKSDKYSLINLFQKIVDQWRSMAIYNRWCSSCT